MAETQAMSIRLERLFKYVWQNAPVFDETPPGEEQSNDDNKSVNENETNGQEVDSLTRSPILDTSVVIHNSVAQWIDTLPLSIIDGESTSISNLSHAPAQDNDAQAETVCAWMYSRPIPTNPNATEDLRTRYFLWYHRLPERAKARALDPDEYMTSGQHDAYDSGRLPSDNDGGLQTMVEVRTSQPKMIQDREMYTWMHTLSISAVRSITERLGTQYFHWYHSLPGYLRSCTLDPDKYMARVQHDSCAGQLRSQEYEEEVQTMNRVRQFETGERETQTSYRPRQHQNNEQGTQTVDVTRKLRYREQGIQTSDVPRRIQHNDQGTQTVNERRQDFYHGTGTQTIDETRFRYTNAPGSHTEERPEEPCIA